MSSISFNSLSKKPHEAAQESELVKKAVEIGKMHQGVLGVPIPALANALGVPPYEIPKQLFKYGSLYSNEL